MAGRRSELHPLSRGNVQVVLSQLSPKGALGIIEHEWMLLPRIIKKVQGEEAHEM
ncbi:MAG: hypothetical protein QXZ16_02885 [Ignisphaera sp.]